MSKIVRDKPNRTNQTPDKTHMDKTKGDIKQTFKQIEFVRNIDF